MRLDHFQRTANGFGRDKRGVVAIMFALVLIGIALAVGLTLDYSRALQAKTALKSAADAAALAALSAVESDYVNNVGSAQMIQDAKTAANLAFVANAGKYYSELAPAGSGATCGNPCITVTVNGLNVVATVGFQAYSPNLFGALASTPTMNISQMDSSASVAQEKLPAYANFYLLLDNTPSMGVGATSADIQNLINLTTNLTATVNGTTYQNPNEAACGFACHEVHPCSASSPPSGCGSTQQSKTYYETNVYAPKFDYLTLARNNNVTLRIDALRQATQSLMSLAANIETANHIPNELQFAVYSFGASANAEQTCALAKIAPPSTSLSTPCNADASVSGDTGALATQVGALDLMATDYQNQYGDQDTSFDTVVPALQKLLPAPGDGTSQASAQEYVIIVSDGVTDEYRNGSRVIAPINTALCTSLKNAGVQVATLYTTYYPIPNNSFYMQHVAPYNPGGANDQLAAAMQSCASSPDLFQKVAVGGNISQALQNIFTKLLQRSRLVQ